MRIVIDLQGAQGATSRRRGIGRYAMALAQGVARHRGPHEVLIALSGLLPDAVAEIRAAFRGLLPPDAVRVWYGVGPVAASEPGTAPRRAASEALREAFLAALAPDMVLVTSLFEGYADAAVTSIGRLARLPTAVLLYDLIPLIRSEVYLADPGVAAWYRDKLADLGRADLLLAISESSRQEALDHLGSDPAHVVTISTAADPHFVPRAVSAADRAGLAARHGLRRPFVMYTGGIDYRKNMEGLITAWRLLPAPLRQRFQLAIVGQMSDNDRTGLRRVAAAAGLGPDDLVLTGYVADDDLVTLYNACHLFVFPSLHEGFGLPVLEAMQCGRAVIASDGSSLPEVVGRADALFDPRSGPAIAAKLAEVLSDDALRADLERHGPQQAARFDWDITARRALDAMIAAQRQRPGGQSMDSARGAGRNGAADRVIPDGAAGADGADGAEDIRAAVPATAKELTGPDRTGPETAEPQAAGPDMPKSAAVPKGRDGQNPRLAYVAPLPPDRSGIADYSAELLPALAAWYDIEVIAPQAEVTDPWVRANLPLRDPDWLRAHAGDYDRVLYHFGNSTFHSHMFGLLEAVPGVVVLHDFYLSGIQAFRGDAAWVPALQAGHGYAAVRERFVPASTEAAIWRYPANLPVLQQAVGMIVHGTEQRRLADAFYGQGTAADWAVVPLLRQPADAGIRQAARARLGLPDDALLVCSFGMIGRTKLNHRLLDAFLQAGVATDSRVHLVFVGENEDGDYGRQLLATIGSARLGAGLGAGHGNRIRITGWTDAALFRTWLAAADIAVQLRALSRGETSAAVLDCMNHAIPTVVNAHGSMADLDPAGVVMLPDLFTDAELAAALDALAGDAALRAAQGARAQAIIRDRHAPADCAARYADAIERFHAQEAQGRGGVQTALVRHLADLVATPADVAAVAGALAKGFPPRPRLRQVLVDVSELVRFDLKTGIQRVVRGILREWLLNPPPGWSVEPVFAPATAPGPYRHARAFTCQFLGVDANWGEDSVADAWPGDIFVALDFDMGAVARQQSVLAAWQDAGVAIHHVVYDLLPHLRPEFFPPENVAHYRRWLAVLRQADGAVCISAAVADELRQAWTGGTGGDRSGGDQSGADTAPGRPEPASVPAPTPDTAPPPPSIGWFHLGADLMSARPDMTMPRDAERLLAALAGAPVFLMVGTVEPRKGHAQVLAGFEHLWDSGRAAHLVIVGRPGWNVEPLVARLAGHPQAGRFLHWPETVTDALLERLYDAADCLIAASEGEGFGLPLVEAAQHGLPLLVRDIPVFREVAGDHAAYFSGTAPGDLARAVTGWLALQAAAKHPVPTGMGWQTWAQSAAQLLDRLGIAAAAAEAQPEIDPAPGVEPAATATTGTTSAAVTAGMATAPPPDAALVPSG